MYTFWPLLSRPTDPDAPRFKDSKGDVRWSVAVAVYQDRQINIGKVTELLSLTELGIHRHFVELEIMLYISPMSLADARIEVETV